MELNKIAKFAETRDAKAYTAAIKARVIGAQNANLINTPAPVAAPALNA